jgi:hypothetical protein
MNFLDTALRLRSHGYKIVPIPHGMKRVVEDGWPAFDLSELDIKRFAERRYKNGNVGILTEHTPGVDLDIYDAVMVAEMGKWIERQFGDIARVGQAPKRLYVFRTERPFTKLDCVYHDGTREHKVEILGKGQQFVAYGTHPDTGKPYDWTSLDEPLTLPVAQLPLLSAADADVILDKFEELATARGWARKRRTGTAREVGSDEDAFERYKPVLAISHEKVLDTLDEIPNDDADYDLYLDIGCALHHQFKGEQEGLQLWHQWAERSGKYDAADLNRRWDSFGHGPETKTFASLLWMANEKRKEAEETAFQHALDRVKRATTLKLLNGDVAKALALSIATDLQFDIAVRLMQDRTKEISETKPRAETIRKQLRGLMPKAAKGTDLPDWCNGWVFVRRHSQFFNTETGEVLSRQSFDLSMGRHLVKEGESVGSLASNVALDVFGMQQVYDYTYLPGEDRIVQIGRLVFVNRFNLNSVPPARQPVSADDYHSIRVMEKHFDMLIPEPREREIFLDWIAYNVQFPREKITWAPLLQSVDGAGKSWIAVLLASMMGSENVRSIAGENLKEDKTSWAEGSKIVVIEEVRLHGANRYDVLDKMKGYVGNLTVPVRRMRTDVYEVINVTNYLMFTNYEDALPINHNDRRYFIVQCSLQTVVQIRRFMADNPGYFAELFSITDFSPDVLRHWFMTRRIADTFDAKGHAPHTQAKDDMREAGEADDSLEDLEDLINKGDPELCDALLNGSKLRGEFGMSLSTRQFGSLLARAGFKRIGKFRVGGRSDPQSTYYTRDFTPFSGPAEMHLETIRKMLEADDGL